MLLWGLNARAVGGFVTADPQDRHPVKPLNVITSVEIRNAGLRLKRSMC